MVTVPNAMNKYFSILLPWFTAQSKLIKTLNKTQRQLCKRLAGPFIPFFWYCLIWKRFSLWMWPLGSSQQPFSCVLGHFWHGDKQSQPGDLSASLLLTSVRRQSFAIVDLIQSLCGRSLVSGAALQHHVSVKTILDSNFSIHHDYHSHPHDYHHHHHHHYLSPGVAKRKQLYMREMKVITPRMSSQNHRNT